MNQLEGKAAVVTGASSGIGKGIAQAFAEEGAKLVLAARNGQKLDAVADELRSAGAAVLSLPTDVSQEGQVITLFERTMQELKRLDILVNNAGICLEEAPLEETSIETWQRTLDVNLTGPFLCTREAMKIMKRQHAGRIINIGSIAAQMPRPNAAPYSCSKIGLLALTKTTALEGRAFGVVASCLHPGNVATAMEDGTRPDGSRESMIVVEDLARVVVTMASLPLHVNILETIVLPTEQPYLGRG
jgi:NAD(P)-dependent dehydrogenase (short-subunit alcohol dehydrogenase family)